ncbi:MAG: hypothetical protein K9H26_19515 [Prolixibacteraceae bacterium]|nr:hypothetical protein [Prolixibacteraceae bacterium]
MKNLFNNIIIWIITFILLSLNILLLFKNNKYFNEKNICENNLKITINKLEKEEYKNEYFLKLFRSQLISWNTTYKLKEDSSLSEKPKLCFRFSNRNCLKCIEKEIELIKNMNKAIKSEELLFLATFADERQKDIFIKTHRIPYTVINCGEINLDMETFNSPYYFILKHNNIEYPFMPNSEYPDLTKQYLSIVSQILNNH